MDKPPSKIRPSANSAIGFALIIGVIIGFLVDQVVPPLNHKTDSPSLNANSDTDLDAMIEAYIVNHPEAIEAALIALNDTRNRESELQAMNILAAVEDTTVMGNPDGDITIYEFSDYNCGYCKRAFTDLLDVLAEDGNVRLVIKEFPILAESSVDAARLALHAGAQAKFEDIHSELMDWRGAISNDLLTGLAEEYDITGFDINDRDSDPMMEILRQNYALGQQFGIEGTPGFIIGGKIYPGAISSQDMLEAINEARNRKNS
ncbi:MAG: hypothetical protein CBC12_13660 [Candidatus Puniceispirillum sp. TMED52]|nr:hypothetical protein [SAR116 cluster bacterium]OUU44143.1 MAG: hypothetical protein CBC12_13660 [Candidatus Puniceispirillum sp. TMED52]